MVHTHTSRAEAGPYSGSRRDAFSVSGRAAARGARATGRARESERCVRDVSCDHLSQSVSYFTVPPRAHPSTAPPRLARSPAPPLRGADTSTEYSLEYSLPGAGGLRLSQRRISGPLAVPVGVRQAIMDIGAAILATGKN